jgi:hypothetical protein
MQERGGIVAPAVLDWSTFQKYAIYWSKVVAQP